MYKPNSPINVLQTIIAVVKLVIFFVMPMIRLTFFGFTVPLLGDFIGLRGLDLNNFGAWLCILPMVLYLVMLAFSVGPLQQYSLIPAAVALVIEIIIIASAGNLLPIDTVAAWVKTTYPSFAGVADVGSGIAKMLLRPSTSFIVSMVLTVLYGVFAVVPASDYIMGMLGLGGGVRHTGGTGTSGRSSTGGHGGARTPRV